MINKTVCMDILNGKIMMKMTTTAVMTTMTMVMIMMMMMTVMTILMRMKTFVSFEPFTHILQGYFTVRLLRWQWSDPEIYEWNLPVHTDNETQHVARDNVSITGVSIVCSTVCSGEDQRRHQSSTSLAFVRGITGDRWIPLTKGQ